MSHVNHQYAQSCKIIFVTGATGNMGYEAIHHLTNTFDDAQIRVLIRPQESKHPLVKLAKKIRKIQLVWGDLTDKGSMHEGVRHADYVLHIGGLVSPLADHLPPEVVENVNVTGTANLLALVKEVASVEHTRFVYIGTVAQTGSRNPPIHWGRTGDPIKISRYDHYAESKTKAEALVASSGIHHWVSLRQSGILHYNMWKTFDPIIFHNPINGVFEWSTLEDSGRLMAEVCQDHVPDIFWRRFYNIGGGDSARIVNHEFMRLNMEAVGVTDFRKIFKPHWLATQNFHGQWYTDSDLLEKLVPYRQTTVSQFLKELPTQIPWLVKAFGRYLPSLIHRRMEGLANAPGGSLYWIAQAQQDKIDAYFGGKSQWERIPKNWEDVVFVQPSTQPSLLEHGYDTNSSVDTWSTQTLRYAAEYRGGRCLDQAEPDSPYDDVNWQCSMGHTFVLSPVLALQGGHWCPTCQFAPQHYSAQALKNPFFAQVWEQEKKSLS